MFWNSRFSWWLLIVVVVGDFAVPGVLSLFYKGYSRTRMEMSELGSRGSPVRLPSSIWLVVQGVLLSLSAVNLYLRYRGTSPGTAAALMAVMLVFAAGSGFIGGLFRLHDSQEIITAGSTVHVLGAVLGFSSLVFEPLLLAALLFGEGDTLLGGVSTACTPAALTCLILFLLAKRPRVHRRIIGLIGLWERAAVAFMYLPLFLAAVKNIL